MMIDALQEEPRCLNVQKPNHLDQTALQRMMHPLVGNPQWYGLLLSWMSDGTCECSRMVWVEYCISETKLGTRC